VLVFLLLVSVFPFEFIALWLTGHLHNKDASSDDTILLYYSLWRLPRFVRLHRLSKLNHVMQYDGHISLLWFTLLRNCAAVLLLTHIEACAMYFIARLDKFSTNTWLGPLVQDYNGLERYVSTLYFCIVTFCTVGYGDYAPKNAAEKIVGSFFMILNIVVAAWIVGVSSLRYMRFNGG
jgi:Ion channel